MAPNTGLQPPLRLKWSYATSSSFQVCPVVAGGVVYVVGADRAIYPLDASTGSLKSSCQTTFYSSPPALDNGMLYLGGDDGVLYALEAGTWQQRWSYNTQSPIRFAPVVSAGVVYVGSGTKLYAINATTGILKWSYDPGATLASPPATADGTVYAPFYNGAAYPLYGEVHALDAATGNVKWKSSLSADTESSG